MTQADLETVVARTGHERYRWLTSDDNPDRESREGYRRIVREAAAGGPAYPSLAAQAVGVVKAAAKFVGSGAAVVDPAEYGRRRAICEACPAFDAARDRCSKCGCWIKAKPWLAAEQCPDDPPRW